MRNFRVRILCQRAEPRFQSHREGAELQNFVRRSTISPSKTGQFLLGRYLRFLLTAIAERIQILCLIGIVDRFQSAQLQLFFDQLDICFQCRFRTESCAKFCCNRRICSSTMLVALISSWRDSRLLSFGTID